MSEQSEVVLWMDNCNSQRMVANRVMMCARNIFLLENMRDIREYEYNSIIMSSGCAGIIKD